MLDPKENHLKVVKRIVHYVKVTSHLCIKYYNENMNPLVNYIDFYWVGDKNGRNSNLGNVFHLEYRTIVQCCEKKIVISLSTIEAKYIGVVNIFT
jgi:hypothetical protein